MSDLKTPFDRPIHPDASDLGGQGVISRGTDPQIDTGGSSGLTASPFDKAIDPNMEGQESANSVSGLPLQPNRFEPSEGVPEIPTLKDRNPGTIDKR
jgi:hypothetical protein